MAEFFRFRSVDVLLGEFQELEKQTIYFASPEELNDPMEGLQNMTWSGDKIVWTNLFRHYVSWSHAAFLGLKILGDDQELRIPISSRLHQLSPFGKDLFDGIWGKFLNMPNISEIIEALANTKHKISYRELRFYLGHIHDVFLGERFKFYVEHGFMPEHEIPVWLEESTIVNRWTSVILASIKASEKIKNDKKLSDVLLFLEHQHNDLKFELKYELPAVLEGILGKNNELVLFDFPDVYAKGLIELPWPKWWTACFTKSCQNSSMWAKYGDSHKGVCLIFGDSLNLKPNKYWVTDFRKVRYGCKPLEIDFFRSIGAGTVTEIMETWYTDQDSNRSECASHVGAGDDENAWQQDYWDNFLDTITTKTGDWEYEQEYRIILYDIMNRFVVENDRVLTYDFNSLKGVIFGIRTSDEDKREIIEIIKKKCNTINRIDFKYFQAYYSPEKGKICKYPIQLR